MKDQIETEAEKKKKKEFVSIKRDKRDTGTWLLKASCVTID